MAACYGKATVLFPTTSCAAVYMELIESYTHSFVIRIWLEETAEESGHAVWRGHITHVPSGERRYLQDLDEILAFIVPYMEEIGVKFGIRWRIWCWLKQAQ